MCPIEFQILNSSADPNVSKDTKYVILNMLI